MLQWPYGGDATYVIRNTQDPKIKIPDELSDEDKERIWNAKVDQYAGRIFNSRKTRMRLTH